MYGFNDQVSNLEFQQRDVNAFLLKPSINCLKGALAGRACFYVFIRDFEVLAVLIDCIVCQMHVGLYVLPNFCGHRVRKRREPS
jgi:hypothetical protein